MERKIEDIHLNIDSETGEISLNGMNLEWVNSIDIHIGAKDLARVVIDMEVESEKIQALIKGEVEWFKNGGKQHAAKGN